MNNGIEEIMDIESVIKIIDDLFKNYNKDVCRFTVDYDDGTDGLYCHYTPYINSYGYSVSDDLLYVCDTSKDDLRRLKDYLDKNKIKSRYECEWSVDWGWAE